MNTTLLAPLTADDQIYVLSYPYTEFFHDELSQISQITDFSDRMQRFKKAFTPSFGYDHIWIELPPKTGTSRNISVICYEGAFDSNCTTEGVLYPKDASYYNLKIFEDEGHEKLLAHLLWNKSGDRGELIHIQRGDTTSGSEIKQIALHLFTALKIQRVVLYDAATLTLTTAFDPETLQMSLYLPIVSPDKKTWYERDGFTPLACKNLPMQELGVVANQDPLIYRSAIDKIRKFDLVTLAQLYWQSPKLAQNKAALCALVLAYLPKKEAPAAFSNLPQVKRHVKGKTVAELGQRIFSAMRESKTSDDFVLFYRYILPTFTYTKAKDKLQDYLALGETLRSVRIWEKHFT